MQVVRPKSELPNHGAALKERIVNRTAKIGVVGAGYIGLPLAVTQAKAGFTVVAVDQNPIRVAQLNQGSNYLRDVDDADLAAVVARGKLSATTGLDRIGEFDVVMCVLTPVTLHQRSRHELHQEDRARDRRAPEARPAHHAREHVVPGSYRRSAASDLSGKRPHRRRRFLPGFFARARRSRKRALRDRQHQ
jgi:glycine/D-amino acid oxidase-like deaminating enzyme